MMETQDLLNPVYQALTDYQEPEDIKLFLFIKKYLDELKQQKSTVNVLDVGCGNGHISRGLGKLGANVVGIDIDESSISKARIEVGDYAKFAVMDVGNLGNVFKPAHFDLIICSEVLEHLEVPKEMVAALYPFLSSGGVLVVTTPNGHGPRETTVTKPVQKLYKMGAGPVIAGVKRAMGYKGATAQSSNPDLTHIQFFTKNNLVDTVVSAGQLELIEFGNANYREKAFPYSLSYKGNPDKKAQDCLRADAIPNEKASGWNTAWRKP